MSRAKHLSMLIVKLVLFVLVFALSSALVSMQTYPTDGISLAKDLDESQIDIFAENGATVTWEVVDGNIVFDITQSGDNYDDIVVFFTFDAVAYDASFIRSLLGEDAGRHEEYISEMENGPWLGHYSFRMTGESFFTTSNSEYTLTDAASGEYVEDIFSSAANKSTRTETFTVEKGDEYLLVGLTFGSEEGGALPNGRYTFYTELKLGHPEGKQLSLGYFDIVGILFKVAGQAIAHAGWNIFSAVNWLTLYGVFVILGWFVYLWRDLRVVIDTFLSASFEASCRIVVNVYVNGVYVGSREEDDGGSLIVGLIYALLVWVVLTLTIPLRMLWYTIRDIIYLFKEDEVLEEFSFLGNLLGSVGIHVILFGLAGVFGAAVPLGIIALVVGVGMCIGAHFLCRAKEL